jgi:hypothetical protein
MQVDERGERHRRAGGADRHDLDPIGIGDRHRAVAGAEVDAIADWTRCHNGTINGVLIPLLGFELGRKHG